MHPCFACCETLFVLVDAVATQGTNSARGELDVPALPTFRRAEPCLAAALPPQRARDMHRSNAQASGLGLDDLFGGLIAALLVFILTTVYTEIREARQRSRERSGLAKVLDAEMAQNLPTLKSVKPIEAVKPGGEGGAGIGLTQEAWLENRARMAQLADRETFDALVAYYRELAQLMEVRPAPPVKEYVDEAEADVDRRRRHIADLQTKASATMQKYINPSTRERLLGF